MATPTAPTVVQPAQESMQAPVAPTGALASILAPVVPARPVKPIGSTASMAEESASSGSDESAKRAERGTSRPEHPVGALVRAIAARIGRTGTTHNVKRQHTITESRVSGNSVNTSNANRANRDVKHHHVGQHRTARDAKVADLNNKVRQQHGRDSRDVKSSDSKAATSASKDGRDVKDHRATQASDTTASKQDTAVHKTHRDGLDPRRGKTADGKTADTKATDTKPGKPAAAKDSDAKKPDSAKTAPQDTAPTDKTRTTAEESPATSPSRPRTQSSREAGYHDGTKAAVVVGHVKAYRDGVQDGYADGTAEYAAEKRRMDDAKARNARQPKKPATPEMAPASGSTVDLAKKDAATAPADAVPARVTGVGENTVSFVADGASHVLSRGEVRTLKAFERRMAAKLPVMRKVAEDSKTARAKAVEHATRARRLAEQAKDVEGGDRLVAKLQRLAEKSEALRSKTQEIEKAAQRGAEAVQVLVANAGTRHGGIYKAVVDSPLTKPAEREFYQDKEGS